MSENKTLKIGLTGGIACGKSTLALRLKFHGARVIDADAAVHEMQQPGGPLSVRIRETFGDEYFDESGALLRKKLGALVFSDKAALEKLNAISRPVIREELLRQMARAQAEELPAVVLDAPLLLEEGLQALCDEVWLAAIPEEEQIRRVMERDGCTEQDALRRMAAQWPTEKKKRYADVVIDTSGSIAESAEKLDRFWQERVENR